MRPWFVVISILVGLLLAGVLGVVWVSMGFVVGREICPHTFQFRQFRYWQPTFFSRGIYKVETLDDTFSIALSLTDTFAATTQQRWDLAHDNHTSRLSRDLEAGLLAGLLDEKTGPEYDWVTWSTAHPELAKRFWPLVSRLAVDRLYVILPELFSLALAWDGASAEGPSPADHFERRLREIVLEELRWMLEEAQLVGDQELEKRLAVALGEYSPSGGGGSPSPGDLQP